VADQRSLAEPIGEIELLPSRELLLSEDVRQRAREMQHEFPSLAQMLAKIAEGIPVDGMESLAPALVDRLVPITHYLPQDAAIAVLAPERVASRAVSLVETNREFLAAAWNAATVGAEAPIDLDSGDFLTLEKLRDAAGSRAWWTFSSFDSGAAADNPVGRVASASERIETSPTSELRDGEHYIRIEASTVPSFQGQANGAIDYVGDLLKNGWSVVVVAQGTGLVERAAEALADQGYAGRVVEELPTDAEPGVAYLLKASVEHGFELPELKLAVLSESEFYGRAAGYDARQVKKLAVRR
jgi:transcription-repair coupling factor (superfamily II helicase)